MQNIDPTDLEQVATPVKSGWHLGSFVAKFETPDDDICELTFSPNKLDHDGSDAIDNIYHVNFRAYKHRGSPGKWITSLRSKEATEIWMVIVNQIVGFVKDHNPLTVSFSDYGSARLKDVLRATMDSLPEILPGYISDSVKGPDGQVYFNVIRTSTPEAIKKDVEDAEAQGTLDPVQLDSLPSDATPIPEPEAAIEDEDVVDPDLAVAPPVEQPEPEPVVEPEPKPESKKKKVPSKPKEAPKGGSVVITKADGKYSVIVNDAEGNKVDSHSASGPGDVLKWVSKSGYGKLKLVRVARS